MLIKPSFQNLHDDKDTSADEDVGTETIRYLAAWAADQMDATRRNGQRDRSIRRPRTLRNSDGQLVKKWGRRQSSIATAAMEERKGGDGSSWPWQQKLCTILLLLRWWGCGGGTKGSSSHSLHLTLSLIIRGTAHCARQAAIWTWDDMPTLP